jgi:hypothetical protein
MFAGEARSLPLDEAAEKCFTRVASLDLLATIRLELGSLTADKHFSLLQTFVYNDCKKCFTFK